ncbi:MAG: alpha/beta fold hydrolase [Patescibacteria group bacterium]|nr:alpha/beta fold hydrolase [Patescibacteria group bacterium]
MQLNHIRFTASDGWKLAGLLFEPTAADIFGTGNGGNTFDSVAVFLHGNGGSSVFESVEKMRSYASALNHQGIAFFAFNNRGSGYIRKLKRLREDGSEEEVKGGTAYELIEECVPDISGALEYLSRKGYRRFFLIGESTGANKIVVYEHLVPDSRVEKLALICGGDDSGIYYTMLGVKRFHELLQDAKKHIDSGSGRELMPPEYLGGMLMSWASFKDTIDPDGLYNIFPFTDHFRKLSLAKKPLFGEFAAIRKPLVVVYGENDEFCNGQVPEILELLKLKSQSTRFEGYMIPGADHGFTGKTDELAALAAEFLADDSLG